MPHTRRCIHSTYSIFYRDPGHHSHRYNRCYTEFLQATRPCCREARCQLWRRRHWRPATGGGDRGGDGRGGSRRDGDGGRDESLAARRRRRRCLNSLTRRRRRCFGRRALSRASQRAPDCTLRLFALRPKRLGREAIRVPEFTPSPLHRKDRHTDPHDGRSSNES